MNRVQAGAVPDRGAQYQAALGACRDAGLDPAALSAPAAAALVVSEHRLLACREVPGVRFDVQQRPAGVRMRICVEPGARPERPVHLCYAMLPPEGWQDIRAEFQIGAGAGVRFLACCTFPRARRVRHQMDARVHIGAGAAMDYAELHFHGPHGGTQVLPRTRVVIDAGGRFASEFSLIHGRAGTLGLRYDVTVGPHGVAELITKAFGRADDRLRLEEVLHLDGEDARGLMKTRIAVRDQAVSEVCTTAEGNAPYTRGHMACAEIVRGQATASNAPHVVVRDDRAHITHEAAIGAVNSTELQTLMARGLAEDDAVDLIIRGMLR